VYTFTIKNNKTDIEIALTRSMLAIAAVAAYVYKKEEQLYLSIAFSAFLLVLAIFTKYISTKIKAGKWIMLVLAAIILYFVTGRIFFPLVLLGYGIILRFLIVDPVITISEKEITVQRNYITSNYPWSDFNNVILKDGLLSLDFKNNKIKYFTIPDPISEAEFNSFCSRFLPISTS
jgi:hypothetical protein